MGNLGIVGDRLRNGVADGYDQIVVCEMEFSDCPGKQRQKKAVMLGDAGQARKRTGLDSELIDGG